MSREQWEERIVNCWTQHKDMSDEEAMMEYLKLAQTLDMYGVHYFNIYNNNQKTLKQAQVFHDTYGIELFDGTDSDDDVHLWLGVHASGINIYKKDNK